MILIVVIFFPFIKLHYGKQLSFSKAPGYYDSAFYLSILGGGGNTIHFTLDGSEPTVNDPVYDRKNPLYIEDATNHPNVYSMKTDTSTGFLTDLVEKYSPQPDPLYTAPLYDVDKCTIVRASLFDSNGNSLDSITGSYFVGFQEKHIYHDIYTVSIITSPQNLFDENIGIYVTGDTFQQYLKENTNKTYLGDINWWWWGANCTQRGSEWERPAHIAVFDNHQNTVLTQKCGIRISGGGSRGMLPRSIACYAREAYDGSNSFQADIFCNNTFPHKIVLFAGGDDNLFKLKDYLANTMERDLHFATMRFIPCALFLDGEYWGMYYITESYNASYIHAHYQVAKNNVIMIKSGSTENLLAEGTEADQQLYEAMSRFIREQDMSDTTNYNHACDLIDIESFIDYYAAQIYIGRCGDWPGSNFALWRTRENDGSVYGDTKWRWMLFDVNSGGLSSKYLPDDSLSYVLTEDPIFLSLYQNEEFRRKFAERLLYIGKEVFAPQKCNQFLDNYTQTLKEPIAASNMRFYMDTKSDEFDQYISDLKTFFAKRYDVVWDFLVNNMGEEWLTENGIQK